MKKTSLTIVFDVFEDAEELPDAERELLAAAQLCLEDAYAPYSNFHVGAAILLDNGAVVTGTNIENGAYPLCLCAEPSALAAAKSAHPDSRPVVMAVSVKNYAIGGMAVPAPVMPCGACRQILREAETRFGHPIRLVMQGEAGEIWAFDSVRDLLPFAFDGGHLGRFTVLKRPD